MNNLNELENKSIYIIRDAFNKFKNIGILWDTGKESTTLIWLIRKAFFGKLPFPLIFIDKEYSFPEIYDFRDKYSKEWKANLIIKKNEDTVKNYEIKTLLLGVIKDGQLKSNNKNQSINLTNEYKTEEGEYTIIQPLLNWRELDIWEYIENENIPVNSLHFAKNGKRYKNLSDIDSNIYIESNADTVNKIIEELKKDNKFEEIKKEPNEKDEYIIQRLRALGYMK